MSRLASWGEYSSESVDHLLYSRILKFNPSLVSATGLKKFNPYARFGLILGTGHIMYEFEVHEEEDITIWKTKLDGGLAVGLC